MHMPNDKQERPGVMLLSGRQTVKWNGPTTEAVFKTDNNQLELL
jgi:hypothetical protein